MSGANHKLPGQLVLDLPLREALGRDDFFVTDANIAAVAAIDNWPDWSNPVLIVQGPEGSGKTHLAEVWKAMANANVVPLAGVTNDIVADLIDAGPVVLEDLPGRGLDEVAMFHLINQAREHNSHILMTSQSSPVSWNIQLPDLISRLKAAQIVKLGAPDDALLRAAIIKQFSDRQILLDEAAVSYILTRTERSFAAIRKLVARIDHESLSQHARVNRHFVAKLLADEQKEPPVL